MQMLHQRRWGMILALLVCFTAVALWILGRLSGRPLSVIEIVGVCGGVASSSAQRLRWCGRDEVLTAKTFLLREPLVYYSLAAPSDDEPSCIDLSLVVQSPQRFGETAPSVYPTYAQLTPAERAEYLDWHSKDRTAAIRHVGYAFLYLCGLERRLLLERTDLDEIVKETTSPTQSSLLLVSRAASASQPIAVSTTRHRQPGVSARFDSQLLATVFAGPPTNCKADDLDVALAWLRQAHLHLPASWAIAAARQDPRVASVAQQVTHKDRLVSLFEMRYRERFGHGLSLRPADRIRELRYQPLNGSLAYREESRRLPERTP